MDNSLPTSLNRNKRLKEQFVSNLSGSSMTEIAALSLIAPLLFVLHHAICYHYNTDSLTKRTSSKKDDNDDAIVSSKNWRAYMTTITMDFLFSVLPMLLFFTVVAQWTFISAIMLSSLVFFIAAKRVLMMLVTCLCILAVDFRIFPRRYAKTETYGTSLMDLGVGSFVIANSLVSRQARGVSVVNLKNTILSTGPVLLLGFVRLVSTRSVDYQVHSAEYGVHWNFFFTLAAVSVITSVINVPPHYSGILGLAILIGNWFSSLEYIFQFYLQKTLYLALLNKFDKVSSGYQYWLSHGLNAYLLSDERGTDILSKNKEGIFSILGYWGLYLVGVQLGYSLFFGNHFSRVGGNKWARIKVSFLSFTFWLATVLLDRHVERVSRRMCNLAYVTLVLAQNLQVLAVLMLSDYIAGSKISALEEAFNQNLLGSFLLANILTGLVNLCVDTLFASSLVALFVLLFYTFSLSMLTGLADFYGVRLKFW